MAEQMAAAIQESILSGDLEPGAVLPTEPELAEQFGVSRAVVRDATRILMALGLVEVQHGRGVFVTQSQAEAFGEALLLALRRAGATVWDVEQFEQILFPEVAALAASTATDEELANLQGLVREYLAVFAEHQADWWDEDPPAAEQERIRSAYRAVIQAVMDATHNQVFQQLAQPLLKLRNLRQWVISDATESAVEQTPETMVRSETAYFQILLDAIGSRDEDQARVTISRLMQLPPQAVEIMRQTPIGERPILPVHPSQVQALFENVPQGSS
jgi:DNA-binding FadR family transcriptional regulator